MLMATIEKDLNGILNVLMKMVSQSLVANAPQITYHNLSAEKFLAKVLWGGLASSWLLYYC